VRPREVKVRIPAGVNDGQRIRVKGRGTPGRNGGPAGDLYVRVRVGADVLFGRKGRDLTISVPITFPEAALGVDLQVPTLDGDPVKVRIPAGTPSGKTFRVKGKGIETQKGRGNLLVTVEIVVPAKLSRDEKKAVEALANLQTTSPREHLEGVSHGS
jgi:molecular chaperone DnaJ